MWCPQEVRSIPFGHKYWNYFSKFFCTITNLSILFGHVIWKYILVMKSLVVKYEKIVLKINIYYHCYYIFVSLMDFLILGYSILSGVSKRALRGQEFVCSASSASFICFLGVYFSHVCTHLRYSGNGTNLFKKLFEWYFKSNNYFTHKILFLLFFLKWNSFSNE